MKSNELRDTIVAIADSKNEAYQQGRADALNEVRNILHDIYSSNLYCHDTSLCDDKGYCLYADFDSAIRAMLKEGEQNEM